MLDEIRKHRAPPIKCFSKPENFIPCITVALSGLLLLLKISRFYETVEKNLRFDITKCKETSKLKTENLFLLEKLSFGPKVIE